LWLGLILRINFGEGEPLIEDESLDEGESFDENSSGWV
jgi:hypothetical protein